MLRDRRLEAIIIIALRKISTEKEIAIRFRFLREETMSIKDIASVLNVSWIEADRLINEGLKELENHLEQMIDVYKFVGGRPFFHFLDIRGFNARQ